MHIIVVGGGKTGIEMSSKLSKDNHVVIIETNKLVVDKITRNEELDVAVIEGSGASYRVLEASGIKRADILVAVTGIDEVNIISCMLGKKYGVKKTVARIRNPEYNQEGSTLSNKQLGIDYIINPENETAQEIKKYIMFPGLNEMEYFADGAIRMMGLVVDSNSSFINQPLKKLQLPQGNIICSILRQDGEVLIPGGNDMLLPGDKIYMLGMSESIHLHRSFNCEEGNQNIIIAGGGKIGFNLSLMLENCKDIKLKTILIDKDLERCKLVAANLKRTLVLCGDVTDFRFMKSQSLDMMDIFVAVTGDDEVNLLSCFVAKQLGVKKTVSEVYKSDYNIILSHVGINKLVSQRMLTIAKAMHLLLRGHVLNFRIIQEDKVEALELVVPKEAPICHKPLKDANLPKGILVGTITRGKLTFIPSGKDRIHPQDRIVVFTLHELIPELENAFAIPIESVTKTINNLLVN